MQRQWEKAIKIRCKTRAADRLILWAEQYQLHLSFHLRVVVRACELLRRNAVRLWILLRCLQVSAWHDYESEKTKRDFLIIIWTQNQFQCETPSYCSTTCSMLFLHSCLPAHRTYIVCLTHNNKFFIITYLQQLVHLEKKTSVPDFHTLISLLGSTFKNQHFP